MVTSDILGTSTVVRSSGAHRRDGSEFDPILEEEETRRPWNIMWTVKGVVREQSVVRLG